MGKISKTGRGSGWLRNKRHQLILAGVASLLGISGSASAIEIPTGNEDIVLRWDNTFRYTLSDRVSGQNKAIINNPNADDGDRNYNVGIVSNRLDILSEADLVYKNDYGLRVSGSGWYDAQNGHNMDNTSLKTSNHLSNGGIQSLGQKEYTNRYFQGPDGELLDAFVFGKFDIAGVPLNVKAGRHTIYWGESLGLAGVLHGITYSQSPIDMGKGLSMPGAEAKELFRPRNNVSFQVQPTSTLSIAGQYFLEWEPVKAAEAGTYLSSSDVILNGAESYILRPGMYAGKGADIEPDGKKDWGLSARWTPEWLDGTAGVYYRKFSDQLPQTYLKPGATAAGVPPTSPAYPLFDPSLTVPSIGKYGEYYFAYAQDIDLYGISLSKQVLGVSVGSELSFRRNMPLVSDAVTVLPKGIANPAKGQVSHLPGEGETYGARGDSWHALVNFLGLISKTPVFDAASWSMEYVWNHVSNVTQSEMLYKGRAGYTGIDKPTSHYIGGAANFTPTWYQVIPGVDMTMPLSISSGLVGNSAVLYGGNKNGGNFSFGFGADIFTKYKADLKYVGFFGDTQTTATASNYPGKIATPGNGSNAMLSDRDMIVLTLKTTF